jgi:hypothetical protein
MQEIGDAKREINNIDGQGRSKEEVVSFSF